MLRFSSLFRSFVVFCDAHGKNSRAGRDSYKYNASYLDIAKLIRQYTAAAPVVLIEFFRLLLVNYLIANGDAHLKNFSLMETTQGDFVLSPAYDLLCTALHVDDSHMALHDRSGMYTGTSFTVFADRAGITSALARQLVDEVVQKTPKAIKLIQRSFLTEDAKKKYIGILGQRHRLLSYR